MAVSTKVGSFALPSATGTQAISGMGFQPKAIIFWTSGSTQASGTWFNNIYAMMGLTAGATNSYAICATSQPNGSTSVASRRFVAKALTFLSFSSSAVYHEADLQSFDADGFTLNYTTVNGNTTGTIINYMAFGGSDITNAKVLNWATSSAAGNQSVTGVGFKPDLMFNMANGMNMGGTGVAARFIFGAMNKHGQQWANSAVINTGVNPTDTGRYQQTDACLIASGADGAIHGQGHFVSMDADGFTVNWSTVFGVHAASLCLKGVSSKIGAIVKTSGAAPATQNVRQVGFWPRGVLFSHVTNSNKSGPQASAYHSVGASDGTNQRASEFGDNDATSPAAPYSIVRSDGSIQIATTAGTTGAVGTLTGMDNNGFNLTFNPNTTDIHEILYVAVSDTGTDTFPTKVA